MTTSYVASEAMTNMVKHAAPERIGVLVSRDGGHLTVRIGDDGRCGADPAKPGLPGSEEDHRRVLAVLLYLNRSRT